MRFLLSTKQTLFKGKLGSEIKASVRRKGYRLSSDLNNQKIINLLEEAIKERLAVKQLKLERRLDLIKLQYDLETKFNQEETSDKTFLKLKEYITTVFLANQTFLIASPENITLRQELQPLLFEDNSFRIDFEKETGDILIWIASKEYPRGFLKALKEDAERTNGKNKNFKFSDWNISRWKDAKEKLYYLHDNRFIYLENRLQNGSFAAPNKNNLANFDFSRVALKHLFRVEIRSWAMIHLD